MLQKTKFAISDDYKVVVERWLPISGRNSFFDSPMQGKKQKKKHLGHDWVCKFFFFFFFFLYYIQLFLTIFKIVNTDEIYFLKLCLDGIRKPDTKLKKKLDKT
jgi:hypothetical protein